MSEQGSFRWTCVQSSSSSDEMEDKRQFHQRFKKKYVTPVVVIQGERLLTMSCSDKAARWCALGLQGALLSRLLEPVRLHSLVLGSLLHPHHMHRSDTCRHCAGPGLRARCSLLTYDTFTRIICTSLLDNNFMVSSTFFRYRYLCIRYISIDTLTRIVLFN